MDTSDCPICFEEFEEANIDAIDFCKVCGNNVHKVSNPITAKRETESANNIIYYRNASTCGRVLKDVTSHVFTAERSGLCQAVPVVALALARTRFMIWIVRTFTKATMLTLQKNWVSRKREIPPLTEAIINITLNISQEIN